MTFAFCGPPNTAGSVQRGVTEWIIVNSLTSRSQLMLTQTWPLFVKLWLNECFGSKLDASRRKPQFALACEVERLEDRTLLSVSSIASLTTMNKSSQTGEKPQSKVWEHDGHFYTAVKQGSNTAVLRLDGETWSPVLNLASGAYSADVKVDGDLVHILLEKGKSSKLVSLQYVESSGSYEFWSVRPQLANLNLNGAETATIDIDSTGRMWVAYDSKDKIVVQYSDGPYTQWSGPIVIAQGIKSDDITAITALPNGTIGVFWSNQKTKHFGFKTHVDGTDPTKWSADEVPGLQSAVNIGKGMADDHMNLAVGSDGTLYVAMKTSYDSNSQVGIGLLVRRPNGTWDKIYSIDATGTRPSLQILEATDTMIVAYRNTDGKGPIYYRESKLSEISFGEEKVLISQSSANNVSSAKSISGTHAVFIAGGGSKVYSAMLGTSGSSLQSNLAASSAQNTQLGSLTPSGAIDDKTPTFTWTAAPNANEYELVVTAVEMGTEVIRTRTNSTSYTATVPLLSGNYRALLKATFAGGSRSDWATEEFSIIDDSNADLFFTALNTVQDASLLGQLV